MPYLRKLRLLGGWTLIVVVVVWLAREGASAIWKKTPDGRARAIENPAIPSDAGRGGASALPPPHSTPGGRMIRGVVQPRDSDEWTLLFLGGQPASVSVTGDHHGSLDCAILDAAGVILDANTSAEGSCELSLVPMQTGNYRILIHGSGSAPVPYQLVTR